MNKTLKYFGIGTACLVPILAFLFWVFCLNHISVNTVGVVYNSLNGEINVQTNAGWYVTSPFVKVVQLDMVPMIVHVPSEAKVINTKVVRLKAEGVREFIKLQGFSYGLNTSLGNILMGYAFSGQQFAFLEVVQEGSAEFPKRP